MGRKLGLKALPPAVHPASIAHIYASAIGSTQKRFAIIIEDDAYSAEILGQYLEFSGVDYQAIHDAKNVLEKVKAFSKVDVIFVDLELPGDSGYNILRIIRGEPALEAVPVVAYTSHTDEKYQAKESGFHSFLGKPLSSAAFPNQLKSILNNEPVWE